MTIGSVQQSAFGQISNTTQSPLTTSKMPEENSLVLVKVLEKLNGSYKLLVDGSVFQSSLPFVVGGEEEFLAKVISLQPFTLQADGLAALKHGMPGALSVLLQKLGLPETLEVKLLVETLLRKKNRF